MRTSVERVRVWLLVGAGLLVAVIAGFLEYAHLRAHRFLHDLPARLGADITRESNGFTYSQSSKGKTVYTIHAAKLVQRRDGKTTLRDVGIVLYGQKQDRADRIYGSEFEYDQKAGVIRAMGIVHLDLQAPAPADARGRAEYAAGQDPGAPNAEMGHSHSDENDQLVHVKTSGLVFVQSLGVASTDQPIEFQYKGLTGQAKGADYSSDTGVTVLQSDVRVSGLRDGQPMLLTAAHAEMDRGKGQLTLATARYVAVGSAASGRGDSRTMTAQQAVVHLRADGSIEHMLGSDGVSLEQSGGLLKARNADVTVNAQNRAQTAHLSGGLTYTANQQLREVEGRAGQGTAHFGPAGRIEKAVMTDAAGLHLRERASPTSSWNERTISGNSISMNFATADGNRQWLRDGTATGAAHMLLVDRTVKGAGPQETTSDVRGDTLTATMQWDGHAAKLSHIVGAGHTLLKRSDTTGAEDTSQGETLEVSFAAASAAHAKPNGSVGAASTVSRAMQRGAVTLTHLPARKPGSPVDPVLMRATATQAVFDGDGQAITLTGQAQVTEGDRLLRAATIVFQRATGDARAEGSVETSYRPQTPSAQTIHVVASRAEFKHDSGHATFYGRAGTPTRMWQGGSQVEAPTLEFSQPEKTLEASTSGQNGELVRTVLSGGDPALKPEHGPGRPEVMRVSSRSLRYTEAARTAQFGGGVVLQDAAGTVRAEQVTAFLKAADAAKVNGLANKDAGFLGGSVDRVTADGAVNVSEPGRRARGERLVYTAADGMFVMTGTATSPPEVVDEVQGTITGAALQFHAGDNSVMVLGSSKDTEARRVRTETRVRRQ